jgi:hypothetical protein
LDPILSVRSLSISFCSLFRLQNIYIQQASKKHGIKLPPPSKLKISTKFCGMFLVDDVVDKRTLLNTSSVFFVMMFGVVEVVVTGISQLNDFISG